jgi:hypothetical protein
MHITTTFLSSREESNEYEASKSGAFGNLLKTCFRKENQNNESSV